MIDTCHRLLDNSRGIKNLIFLTAYVCLCCISSSSETATVTFVKAGKNDIKEVGVSDTNVVFNWDFNLDEPDALKTIYFGFYKSDGTKFFFAIKDKGKDYSIRDKLSASDKNNFIVDINDTSTARLTLKEIFLNQNNRKFCCMVELLNGNSIISNVILKVYVPPTIIHKSGTFKSLKEGEPLTLECKASAEPKALIQWRSTSNKVLPYNNATGELEILSVSRNDSGNYTCTASNLAGNATITIQIQVQYAPDILPISTKRIGTYMKNPDPIYLRCIVDAVPPAVFKWSDPKGNQVSEEPTYIIQDPDEDKYFGTYTCRASNIVHFSDHTVEVIKISNPEPVTLTTKTVNARTATFDMKVPTDTGKSELKDTIKIVYQDTKTGLIQQKVLIGLARSTIQLDKLTPYTDYVLNVTVENEYFSSTGQKLAFKTLEAVPGIPSNITIDSTVSSITINWQPPTNPNGIITKFIYKFYKNIDPINDTEIEVSSSVLNKTFNNLGTAYQQYAFRIRAVNNAGEGDWTPVLTRYTDPEPPSSPRNLTVTTSIQLQKHYLNINWKPPIKGSNTITKYEIKINTTSLEDNSNLQPFTHTANAKSIPQRNYKIATKPYSKAFVWVREGGGDKPVWGSFAGPFEVTTPQGVPTPPLKLVVLGTTSDKVHLRWNKPQKINGVLHKFTIEYRKKNTNDRKQQYLARQLDTNTTFFHTLDGLESLSPYYVNVYAHSRSGDRSNSSNVVTALTEVALAPVAPRQTADEESNLTPIIGGVVAFVFLLAVAIAVFLYMSKRRSRLKSASSANSDSQFFKLNDRETKAPPLDVTDGSTMNLSVVSNFGNEYGKDSERCFKLLRPIQLTDLKERIIFQTSNNNKGFIDEFRSIKVEADLTYEVSTKPENKVKNRYANILAYDHSRVVLNNVENLDDSDYINANYIDGFDRSSKFIATQGPVVAAFGDFWRMIWEQNTRVIVMVTNLIEKGRAKCQQYWPNLGEGENDYENFKVSNIDENELADYTIRTFHIKMIKKGEEVSTRKIMQFQFVSWPDHGCPMFPSQLLQFIKRIRALTHNAGPIVLHCSAGVGRTGTYMAIDAMLDQVEKEQMVDIFGYVTHIRSQRSLMVQTEPQYIFIYKAILESISCGNTEVNAADLPAKIKHLNAINPSTTQTFIREEFDRLSTNLEPLEDYDSALLPCNTAKNRFQDIIPYETMRVKLWPYPDIEGSDYINASFVDGYQQREAYILTQAPQQNTIQDFWRMLWEYEVFSIVMVTSSPESNMSHCYPYWPTEKEPASFGLLRVTIGELEEHNGYVKRQFRATNTKSGEARTISHFMYFDWAVNATPDAPSVIELIGVLQKTQQMTGNSSIVIHCSDGSGRSGALAALMYCIERVKLEGLVDVFQAVRSMRTHRISLVQTLEQYQFIYNAVSNYLDCFSNYANFK